MTSRAKFSASISSQRLLPGQRQRRAPAVAAGRRLLARRCRRDREQPDAAAATRFARPPVDRLGGDDDVDPRAAPGAERQRAGAADGDLDRVQGGLEPRPAVRPGGRAARSCEASR